MLLPWTCLISGDPDPGHGPHEELDTQGLARAAKAGDDARFAELYERIGPALFTWASLRIRPSMRGVLDPQDMARAFPALGSFITDIAMPAQGVPAEADMAVVEL